MFGTLVVQLPSDYSGGQLVVSHCGNDKVFDFSGIKGCTNFHYAAFYADCKHELKMVTKGYRLCLIYNLLYSGPGSLRVPIEDTFAVSQLKKAMQLWNGEASKHKGPPLMAYILEHKYCATSLSFKGLKNIDRAVGDVLAKACQTVNFDLYLGHVSRTEVWTASCNQKKFTLEELCNDSIDASHLISPQGQKPAHFNEVFLDNGAMVPKEKYNLRKPDEEERSEATGNEGASVERWYKWTALILWPQKRRLMNIGCDKMTDMLKINVIRRSTPLTAPEKEENLKLARELVESDGHSSMSAVSLLQCLYTLEQKELIRRFLSREIDDHILINAGFRNVVFSLCGSCVGWEIMRPSLLALMNKSDRYFTTCCDILTELVATFLKEPSAAQPKSLCRELATTLVRGSSTHGKYDAYSVDAGISMLKVLLSLGDDTLVSPYLLFLCCATYERYTDVTILLHSKPFVEQLLAIGKAMGWVTLKQGLMGLFKKTTSANVTDYCNFLYRLICRDDLIQLQQQVVGRYLMDVILKIVIMEQDIDPQAFRQPPYSGTSRDFQQDQERRAVRSQDFVRSLLRVLITLDYDTLISETVADAFLRQPNRYPLNTTVLPALENIRSSLRVFNSTFVSIVARCITVVQGWSNPGPIEDWSRNVTITCMSCADCKTLQEFLRDPVQNLFRFRINQARRSHIAEQLNTLKCGTTHFTEKSGTPRVLVINKVGAQIQERDPPTPQQVESLRILMARLLALCPPQLGGASSSTAAIPQLLAPCPPQLLGGASSSVAATPQLLVPCPPQLLGVASSSTAATPQLKKQKMDSGVPPTDTGTPRR